MPDHPTSRLGTKCGVTKTSAVSWWLGERGLLPNEATGWSCKCENKESLV